MTTTTGEDPKVLANYRFARGAVIILSILIVIALVALLLGFTRGGARPAAVPSSGGVQNVMLPSGSHIVSMDVEQGRLILRTRAYAGEEVDIIDTQDGHVIGRINVPLESGEKPPK
jgi:hypothetical protein